MRAKDVLLEALEKFTGTVVFVSHDRYFIDKLATRVFEIGDGEVHVFPGNYEDYLWRKQRPASAETSQPARTATDGNGHGSLPVAEAAPKKKLNPYKLREMQERRQQLEQDIARAEADIAGYEQSVQTFVSAEESVRVTSLIEQRRGKTGEADRRLGRGFARARGSEVADRALRSEIPFSRVSAPRF